jgi:hypothetical protein
VIVLAYFLSKIDDREELVHDEGAVVVAPPVELKEGLATRS